MFSHKTTNLLNFVFIYGDTYRITYMYLGSSAQVCWRSSFVEAGAVYKNSLRTTRRQSEDREKLTRGEAMQLNFSAISINCISIV